MDIDDRLREAGQRWRESQGPALPPPSLERSGDVAPRRQWLRVLAPAAAAAAVAGIVFGIASLHDATTGRPAVPAGALASRPPSVSSTLPKPSTSTTAQPSLAATATPSPAAACVGSQLRPSLGGSGSAGGAGHTQILLKNVSGQPCYLARVFPLEGIKAAGTATRLVFPGDSATSYPSPVAPGNVAPGEFGAFWVTTQLNGCPDGARFSSLLIEVSPQQNVRMLWPTSMSTGCLAAESAAGPFPQPVPSIP